MAIASFNRKAIQAAGGKVYLLATPASVVAVTAPTIVKELFGAFFTDGDARSALKGGVVPWTIMEKSGFKGKIKGKEIMIDPNEGPEEAIGFEAIGYEAEITIYDVDVQKMKDVISASVNTVIATAKSPTTAKRETLLGGGQRIATDFMLLYRFQSRQVPTEFNHVLIPACNLLIDTETDYSKTKARELKVKIRAKASGLLIDPDTNNDVIWIEDYAQDVKG